MLKFINISLLLLLFSNMAMAQSSLVFYDANQSRMGTLVRPIGAGSNNLELMTHDGYLITIGTEIGVITEPTNDPKPEVLHFSNEDCTGISYFSANSDWMKHRGGQIIRVGPLPGELFSVEWGSFASIEMRSSLSFFAVGCSIEEQGYIVSEAVKATAVNPADYGITMVDADPGEGEVLVLGFLPPFSARIEKSNIISCNGFESCPVQK